MSGTGRGLRAVSFVALALLLFFVVSASGGMVIQGGELHAPTFSRGLFTLLAAAVVGVVAYYFRGSSLEAGALTLGAFALSGPTWTAGVRRINGRVTSAAIAPPEALPVFESSPLLFPLQSWTPLLLFGVVAVSFWRTHRWRAVLAGSLFGYGYGVWMIARAAIFMSSKSAWITLPWVWSIVGSAIAAVGLGILSLWLLPIALLWLGIQFPVFFESAGGPIAYPTTFLDPGKQATVLLVFIALAYATAWKLFEEAADPNAL